MTGFASLARLFLAYQPFDNQHEKVIFTLTFPFSRSLQDLGVILVACYVPHPYSNLLRGLTADPLN